MIRRLVLVPTLMLALAIAALAAAPQGLILHGPRDRARVALSFDVCQVPGKPSGFDAALVEVLVSRRIPATFFLGGDWLRTHPEEARRLAAVPFFELANHSWSHPDLRRLDAAAIRAEVERTDAALRPLTGREVHLFRLPFGWHDDRVVQTLREMGRQVIQWDVVSGDPDPQVSAAAIRAAVRQGARPGSIIIFHANGRGWHSAEALPAVLDDLAARGLEPVTVSDLLNSAGGN